MRLIQWNCQGSFRTKNERILGYNPDILVVSECENPERLKFGKLTPQPRDYYWYGDNEHKGIGVFCYTDYKIKLTEDFNPEHRYVLPFKVTKGKQELNLFAIWAMSNKVNYDARYIGQVWYAINRYDALLESNSVLIGDFNSNKIWDRKKRVGNHTDVVNRLVEKDIISLYHKKFQLEHGKENHPTFFLQRNLDKAYHIDYCFASTELIQNGFDFEVGEAKEWIDISDHSPIIIDLK